MKRPKLETIVLAATLLQLFIAFSGWLLLAIGFEGKTPGTVIRELQAEVRVNKEATDGTFNDLRETLRYVKDLSESNTIMLCSLSSDAVTINMPCVRIQRERGLR